MSKPRSTSRSTDVIALLERLDKIHGLSRRQRANLPRLFSITARFTKAKATRAALARAPGLTPEWRPKYGPERNAIERDWKTRKTHHLADKTFQDRDALNAEIEAGVQDMNSKRKTQALVKLRISA